MNVEVNYVAVLIAGIVSMGVGFIWYSNLLFAKPWMKLMGHTKETMAKSQKQLGPMYFLSFIATLVTAYMLSHVMTLSENFYGFTPMTTGLTTAFSVWIGFVMPVQLTDMIFGGKKWQLFAINTGYQLASLLVIGVVLAYFA